MAHYGTLREFRFKEDIQDIRGSDIYGRDDDKLGEISDVIFDHSTGEIQYAIVDTGGWLSSRKFLVPADRIEQRANDKDDYRIDMTKAEVESLPAYDENRMQSENEWRDFDRDYREKWETTGGVMHKEGSTNIITPEPHEMPAGVSSAEHVGDVTPDRLAGTFPSTAPDPSKTRLRPSGIASRAEDTRIPGTARTATDAREWTEPDPALRNAGSEPRTDYSMDRAHVRSERCGNRWRAFEDHLRKNRVDVTSSCRSCGPSKDRAA